MRTPVPMLGSAFIASLLFVACSSAPPGEAVGESIASAITTTDVISRATEWVDARLHYCQAAHDAVDGDSSCWAFEGPSHRCDRESNAAWNAYRSDCSGLVTWAWGLPPVGDGGYVTGDFAPFDSAFSHTISGEDLQPGDALNKVTNEHIVLFKEWVDRGHVAVFIEEPGCSVSTPYAHEFTSDVSIKGSDVTIAFEGSTPFVAIRFDHATLPAPPKPKPPATTPTPAVVKLPDGYLEVFERGGGDALFHDWQESAANGKWSGWAGLGGELVSDVTVVINGEGREEVFAVDEHKALVHKWLDASHEWSGWASLGGDVTSDLAVILDADKRMHVFARGTTDALYVVSEGASGAWGKLESLGGTITSNASVAMNEDGRLEVFALGEKGVPYHQWQKVAGGWSGWESLGGELSGKPTAVKDAEGKLEVFALGTNKAIYRNAQKSPGGAWTGWHSLGGEGTSTVAVGTNEDGRLEIFVRGTNDALYHAWEHTPGGSFTGFASLGGTLTSDPSVALNKENELEVFARGTNDALYHAWEDTKDKGGWTGWESLGGKVE
jgi:hypothetical protein